MALIENAAGIPVEPGSRSLAGHIFLLAGGLQPQNSLGGEDDGFTNESSGLFRRSAMV
jgi:hypothetical protein